MMEGNAGRRRWGAAVAGAALLVGCAHGGPALRAAEPGGKDLRADSLAAPIYPPGYKAAGIEGDVTVRFAVRADGSVDTASVATTHGPSARPFGEAVRRAVGTWRFRPGTPPGARTGAVLVRFRVGPLCPTTGAQPPHTAWRTREHPAELTVTVCMNRLVPGH